MQLPIPSDDAGNLECLRIMWPASQEWRAVLTGLIYSLTRGRSWDARTGVVKDAQSAAWELFNANFPWLDCANSSENEGGGASQCGGAILVVEDEDMGQVVTDVTVNESGQLVVWFGPCCSRAVGITLDSLAATSDDRDADLPDEYNPETTSQDVRCQKAGIITRNLSNMANLLLQYLANPLVAGYRSLLTAEYPNVSFDWIDMANAFVVLLVSEISDDGLSDVSHEMSTYKCNLAAQFANTWTVTAEDFTLMKTALHSAFDLDSDALLHAIIDSVGRGDWGNIVAAEIATSSVYDCGCPETPIPAYDPVLQVPSGMDWLYDIDFKTGLNGFGLGSNSYWSEGEGVRVDDIVRNNISGHWNPASVNILSSTSSMVRYAYASIPVWPTAPTCSSYIFRWNSTAAQFVQPTVPFQPYYEILFPNGQAWNASQTFVCINGGSFGNAEVVEGDSVLDRIVLAGTGSPPLPSLTNLLG